MASSASTDGSSAASANYSEVMRVRYRDTDAQGHMFFANYLVFADEVTGNFMKTLGFDWSRPEDMTCFVFTANANCDFVHECRGGDDVRVDVRYESVGNTSAKLSFDLTRVSDEQTLVRGSFVQVFVDPQTRKPMPVPDLVRSALSPSA
ncbi:MAG: thioesterase family protein [Pseudomonadota bacterium]